MLGDPGAAGLAAEVLEEAGRFGLHQLGDGADTSRSSSSAPAAVRISITLAQLR